MNDQSTNTTIQIERDEESHCTTFSIGQAALDILDLGGCNLILQDACMALDDMNLLNDLLQIVQAALLLRGARS